MESKNAYLKVNAVEYINWFPGFLKCELIDRLGNKHEFIEKIPVICGADQHFDQSSWFPVEITIRGKVLKEHAEGWYAFSTLEPFEISSEEGKTEFEVNKDQLFFTSE